jgi:putative heme iron utilization protein
MNPTQASSLRTILESQRNASLGTLHDGEPFVSMVPFALMPGGGGFVIHVSGLAAHTKDMMQYPRVSIMVMAPQSPDVPAQALPRVTVQSEAVRLDESDRAHPIARTAYLGRFPEAETTLALGDFSLFVLSPLSLRLISGFGAAATLTPADLAQAFM